MISTTDICSVFNKVMNDGWGVAPGFDGQVLTQEMLDEKVTDEGLKKSASKWLGKHVVDAGGLFAHAFRTLGMFDGYNPDGSYPHTIFTEFCEEFGKLPKADITPGMVVFKKRGDRYFGVGLYVGNNRIIEAKSTKVGIVSSPLNGEWTYWGKLKNVDYEPVQPKKDIPKEEPKKDTRVLRGEVYVGGNTKKVRLRSKPNFESDILDLLPSGQRVTVLEDCGDFCRVQLLKIGYIKKEFLQEG